MTEPFAKLVEKSSDGLDEFIKNIRVQGEIEFPIEVSAIESQVSMPRHAVRVGSWVSIRPASDKKTYLGVYLGDLILDCFHSYNLKTKVVTTVPHNNPAILVPDLKRVVWGCESWWGFLDSPEKLRQISDADIQNVWYVKALKDLTENAPPPATEGVASGRSDGK